MVPVRLAGAEVTEGFCTSAAVVSCAFPLATSASTSQPRSPQVSIEAKTRGKNFHECTTRAVTRAGSLKQPHNRGFVSFLIALCGSAAMMRSLELKA